MARILLAVDYEVEVALLEGIIRAGHEIVDRVTGAAALAAGVERARPDLVVAQAGPETLNRASLARCDAAGARAIAVVGNDVERRQAAELGIVDRIAADEGWDAVERLLAGTQPPRAARPPAPGPAEVAAAEAAGDLAPGADASGEPGRTASRKERRREESRARRQSAPRESAPRRKRAPKPHDPAGGASTGYPAADLTAQPPAHEAPLGRVVAVWGPHGAPGATTVAIALAASLANQGRRVLLIDADTYGGAVAPALGISDEAPGLAAACRLAGAGSLTSDELDRVSSECATAKGKLRVLVGISNPARWPELGAERVRGVIARARDQYDVVVIDVGFNLERDEELVSDVAAPRRNAATHAAVDAADLVVALGEATPVGVQRYLRARLGLVDLLGPDARIETVMNRLRRSVTGADSAGQVRQVLLRFGGIEQSTLLPDDPRAVDRAAAEAIAVVDAAPRSQLAKQLDAIAVRVLAQLDALPRRVADMHRARTVVQ
ncbi:AAA family ATPase [Gulosibacter faecalis]|uniref:CpaE family protein n=1 Tax=Gulosibacter faecalis TaxID=272240 RepID=A0ABW5V045_9MICO